MREKSYANINIHYNAKLEICYFSLEQANTIMRKDPFKRIEFGPPNLFGTKLLHTMFFCDYVLKWFINVNEGPRKNAKETEEEFTLYQSPIDIDLLPESFKV